MKKRTHIIISSAGIALLTGAIVASNIVFDKYSGVLKPFFGFTGRSCTTVDYDNVDPYYYNKEDKTTLNNSLAQLGNDVAAEGIVLLEKGNTFPHSVDNKLNLFSKSSVDFVFGGTGSGAASGNLNLKESLEDAGFTVNSDLWNFYANGAGASYHRGIGSINYGDSDDFSINEVPLSKIINSGVQNTFNSNDTGVFVLSRTGGEGNDLARGMADYVNTSLDKNNGQHPDATADLYKSYLQPDSIELEIMNYIDQTFDDFILIVNCNNAMELDFVKSFDKKPTIIHVPATGETGLNQLGKILKGTVATSGRLADTYVKDSFKIPSSENIGDFEYLVNGNKLGNIMGWDSFKGLYYMNYDESIYVGYRYFETRYADLYLDNNNNAESGNWKYEDNVIYPFGYGDSIADFTYSNFSVSCSDGGYDISVTVTNSSQNNVSAKHAVELYVSSPYGVYESSNGIEKSAIDLIDFDKTRLLNKGESEVVNFRVEKEQLLTYSDKFGEYYLPGGTYYFTVGYDAHSAINNVLKAQGKTGLVKSPSETIAGDASVVDSISIAQDTSSFDALASNQFDFVDARTYDNSHKYFSRSDWDTTYPTIQGTLSNIRSIHSERTFQAPNGQIGSFEFIKEVPANYQVILDTFNFETKNPGIDTNSLSIKWGKKTNLDAVDLRGLDIDDPRYDEVVNAISLQDAIDLFAYAGYETISIKSINKPRTFDTDGPAGFNTVSGHSALGYNYPCSLIIAQTWNKDLMKQVGEGFGKESLITEIQGWYGPTANIHRSPFGGRNFEYFSEDPVLTGTAAKLELNGAATYGLYGYLKHFALNDQETHREKENGVCIFANEQTIREIYLKPFEMAIRNNTVDETYYEIQRDASNNIIKENGQPKFIKKTTKVNACTAIMSSFSRLGGVWAGGCYPLLNNVLREEWDFKGMILTDYFHNWMMSKGQSLIGGGTAILDPQSNTYNIANSDKESQYYLHNATKHTLYTIVNSNAVNGYVHGVKEIPQFFYYWYLQIGVNVVFGLGIVILSINIVCKVTGKKLFKRKKKEINND